MQSIWGISVAEDNNQWPIEELGAVNLDLVRIRVPGELRAVSL